MARALPTSPDDTDSGAEGVRMTLGEHLDELRWRLVRSTVALFVAFAVLYSFRHDVSSWIQKPYERVSIPLNEKLDRVYREQAESDPTVLETRFVEQNGEYVLRDSVKFPPEMQSLRSGGTFVQKIRICAWLSLLLAGPYVLWELWMFIAAGLYKAERKVVYSFFPVSLALFATGIVFGFLVLFPAALYFTQADGLGLDNIKRDVDFDQYLQLMRSLTLAIGLIFQLPIIQVVLARVGLVHPRNFAKFRGHMAVITLIVAAVLTPPDPMTQLILAGPAIILWEIGIWCAKLAWREPEPLPGESLSGDEPTTEITSGGAST